MARVLVISEDRIPLGGATATGAGLRTLGLGEGLRARGHTVTYAMPRELRDDATPREVEHFDANDVATLLDRVDPDVAVFQHWPLVAGLPHGHRSHVVIDFHGPLLLETLYRNADGVATALDLKLAALRRADFFTCAGPTQYAYFLAFLLLAGFDLRDPPLAVVPFSLSPELPERTRGSDDPIFVYGGVFLPWQDPALGLRVLVEELDAAGRGELHLFGGRHPWMDLPSGAGYDDLVRTLERSSRVHVRGSVGRRELVAEYARATVAWDVMAQNPERRLAFTSRTVEYLWCGLPVVYNDYADLAAPIRDARAGWIVDPDDEGAMRTTVREILADGADCAARSENAQALVRERLTWDRTIEPLAEFCAHPRRPARLDATPGAELASGVVYVAVSPEVARMLGALRRLLPVTAIRALRGVLRRTS